jgi:hypothetical protein
MLHGISSTSGCSMTCHTYLSIYLSMYLSIYLSYLSIYNIYIYVERERERNTKLQATGNVDKPYSCISFNYVIKITSKLVVNAYTGIELRILTYSIQQGTKFQV